MNNWYYWVLCVPAGWLIGRAIAGVMNWRDQRMPADLARAFYCEPHEWDTYNSTTDRCGKCGSTREAAR